MITQRTFAYLNFAFLFFIMGHPLSLIAAVALTTYSNPVARVGEEKLAAAATFLEKGLAKLPSKPK